MTARQSSSLQAAPGRVAAAALVLLAAAASADTTPLASVQLMEHPANASPAGLPADGPKVLVYFRKDASAPSCGLLPRGGSKITPLLETADGEDFPQCTGVPVASSFHWQGHAVYVVRFLQRDTREDTSETDAAVIDGPGGLAPIAGLDESAMPSKKPIATVASWIKAQLVAQEEAKAGFKPSPRDTAATDAGFLAVGIDLGGGRCRLIAGPVASDSAAATATTPCSAVLATTAFASGAASWFVAMLKGPAHETGVRVFSVDAHAAREATELEAELASIAAGGKILPVRDALRRLVAEHGSR